MEKSLIHSFINVIVAALPAAAPAWADDTDEDGMADDID